MRLHQCVNQCFEIPNQTALAIHLRHDFFKQTEHVGDVTLPQRKNQGILVRKILIKRADADAGRFRHKIGIGLGVASLDEYPGDGIENRIYIAFERAWRGSFRGCSFIFWSSKNASL